MTTIRPTNPRKDDAPLSFEFEDGSPATAPIQPAADAPAPAFNPFADQPVSLSLDAVPTAPTVPTGQTPSKAHKAVPQSIAPAIAPGIAPKVVPAPGAAPSIAPTPDGSVADGVTSRDLWHCPHCGAGNQPKRTTCRECNKSPDEPVVVPFARTPLGMAVIVVVVAVVAFAAWRFLLRTDKSFHTPGPTAIDLNVRTWGLTDKDQEVGTNRIFNKRGEFAVSGRVLAAKAIGGNDWITTVVLALGPDATTEAFTSWGATIGDTDISSSAPSFVVLHCLFDAPAPELNRGTYLSLSGLRGNLLENGQFVTFTTGPGHLSVKVARFEVGGGP